jgi:CubicO group peptidase (beta-lactamase class C family)
MPLQNLDKLDAAIEPILRAARIPGAALAVVSGDKTVYARGFGYRNLKSKQPVTADTSYPIASTTKAINATLLAMLAEEGRLDWDAPVQRYLPQFRLKDPFASARVTVRDLVTLRTGLPRHDWIWVANAKITRAELVASLAHVEPSVDFRRRFQYNNLTVTTSGHIAEVITGQSWESLVRRKLFQPLGMRRTTTDRPGHANVTLSYHENARRKLLVSKLLPAVSTAPSGGAVYSTVNDMARWVSFNLKGGKLRSRRLLSAKTLAQVHASQVVIGERPLAGLPPEGAYALGWLVDYYNGHKRISHGGYLHDINSSVMFFPNANLGMVSFINFGPPVLADLINQYAFDTLMGLKPVQTLEEKVKFYEKRIEDNRKRLAAVKRTPHTRPSHPLAEYLGRYEHPGYGEIQIARRGRMLLLKRYALSLPLQHWHYDSWVAESNEMW